jgi:ferritin-like protein
MAQDGKLDSPPEVVQEPTTEAEPPPEKPAEKPEPAEKPADETTLDEDEPDKDELGGEAKADPDLQKRLAVVAKHERRAKEREAAVKAAIEKERGELRREREAIEREIRDAKGEIDRFAQLKDRARFDPAGVLKALGLVDDDFGPAARQLWALTKEQAQDPRNREAAARMMKDRESEDRITRLERELAEQKKAASEHTERARAAEKAEAYLANVIKAATDEHPLAKRLIEKSPQKSRERFAAIADELFDREGDLPDADDVLAEYEKRRRAELEDDGVDVAAMLKLKPRARTEATTLGNDIGSTTAPASNGTVKKTMAEKKADLERELRALDLRGR